jgi:hypothetical protein
VTSARGRTLGQVEQIADYFRLPTETMVFSHCAQMLRFCAAS